MSSFSLVERLHDEQFVAAVVEYLHRDLARLAGLERRTHGPREVVPHRLLELRLQGLAQAVPGTRAREERLRHVEGEAVPGSVEEPCGDVVAARMPSLERRRVERVEPEQLGLVALCAALLLGIDLANDDIGKPRDREELARPHR